MSKIFRLCIGFMFLRRIRKMLKTGNFGFKHFLVIIYADL